MAFTIRGMEERDREAVREMMRVFYASEAVLSNGSEEIFAADFEGCVGDSPYLEGFIFEHGGEVAGYGMIARSFSTEFGKPCVWIEDVYVKDGYRGLGIGSGFLDYVEKSNPHALLRLEVEEENTRAMHVYKKCGFEVLPYTEMKK